MQKIFLYSTLFITGGIILVIEIAGTRLIAPLYGSSIYVWSSLITVTLAALAAGYFFGGRLADRKPQYHFLYGSILTAGLVVSLLTKLDTFILSMTRQFGFVAGPLVATAILFGLPLLLLAMATPFAVRLKTTSVRDVGETSGGLYAVSTTGSIAGALLTGFVLIPNIGVSAILYGSGLLLIAVSLLWFAVEKFFRVGVVGFVIASIIFFMPSATSSSPAGIHILHDSSSFYGRMQVVEQGAKRYLLIDGIPQTGIDISTGESVLPYTTTLAMSRLLTTEEPKNALMIGLGGGVIAKEFNSYGIAMDVIEIEPRVQDIAQKFFDFPGQGVTVVIDDGRHYLDESEKTYDIIVIDAFGAEQAPSHLMSREAFGLIREHLRPGGILAINVWANMSTPMVPSLHSTLSVVFNDVVMLVGANTGSTNVALFAGNAMPGDLLSQIVARCEFDECRDLYTDIVDTDMRGVYDTSSAIVLTDDYNPLISWQQQASHDFRNWIFNYFGSEILI